MAPAVGEGPLSNPVAAVSVQAVLAAGRQGTTARAARRWSGAAGGGSGELEIVRQQQQRGGLIDKGDALKRTR